MTNRIPEPDIIGWLMDHCQYDRVLLNALCNHRHRPVCRWNEGSSEWAVVAHSRSDRVYRIVIVPHAVTGEPDHFYRLSDEKAYNED